jgi:rhamnogalacturonan endolyase
MSCYMRRDYAVLLLAAAAFSAAQGADLFRDDFAHFPPGWLTNPLGLLNAAIQEYHYVASRGIPLGAWENAISHLDAWVAGDEAGKPYLEQQLDSTANQFSNPIFLTGDPEWADYTVEAKVKPLLLNGTAGVVFRYHTNRHYYMFGLSDGHRARLLMHEPIEDTFRVPKWRELATADFIYDAKRYYTLRVENEGPRIRASIDGRAVLEAPDDEILRGKAGITASMPARFQDFSVGTTPGNTTAISDRIRVRERELEQLRAGNPRPKLWKKFDTPKFGAGRNARFGDLDGDGTADMLIAQNIARVRGDAFDQISCLTAVNFDGKILWQSGRPDPRNGLLTNDTPFQIHDIDGDGKNEVVVVRDFQLQILDGRNGSVRRSVWMPKMPREDKERPYEMENGDSIAFVNFLGDKGRHEILVKDRYNHFWVYNNSLELLWSGDGQTGHYPYLVPDASSSRDLLLIGYSLWDHNGHRIWSHDRDLHDHADGIAMENLTADSNAEPRVYAAGSDEGVMLFDRGGQILKHVRIGHAQSPTIGKYRMDVPGLQFVTVNFWKNPGIITVFDADANILAQGEPIHSGSVMLPVNWRGDGQEFILLSGSSREGGMIDGQLRRVVVFPEDGHPDLTANILNVTGDARDEIILWDENRVWIYTQDRPFAGKRLYAPIRNADYNESNYRTNVSLPNWVDVR